MRVINIPIEPLEERYSTQWQNWFTEEFSKLNVPFIDIPGTSLTDKIETGSFLDVYGTNFYKASQIQNIVTMLYNQSIGDRDDVFFFHDLWFPGLESLAYIRNATGANFKITGCLHAGTYDPNDFLSKKLMGSWGRFIEQGWFRFVDRIFVATEYHKYLLMKTERVEDPDKIKVTGFPLYLNDFVPKNIQKEKIVVFPHRLDEEKQPHLFDRLAEELSKDSTFSDWRFVKTKEICTSKGEYYKLLASAKIAVSFALQETWGIAMQEALHCGCIPVVPDRLSYQEMYYSEFRYQNWNELIDMMKGFRKAYDSILLAENADELRRKGAFAVSNIVGEMKML